MDKREAAGIAASRLEELRATPFAELQRLIGKPVTGERVGPSGTRYQIETEVFRDGEGQNLRVMVCVDDGGWRALKPLCDDFIVAPDGSFIGE